MSLAAWRQGAWPWALPAILVTLVVLLPFLWLSLLSFTEGASRR